MSMDPDEFKEECRGIIPIQYCPMTEDGELDFKGLAENTQFLVDFANDGDKDVVIMTNGSTTEFYTNSTGEQKKVIETVVNTVDGDVPVIAGVSHSGTRETIKMAKYAEEAGADCAMVVLPYYHTPDREGMYEHYKEIADAVDIGIMIYNNPDVSGSLIPPDLMAELAEIDNIVAVKDNTPNAAEYGQKVALIDSDDMTLLNGLGEIHYLGSAAYGNVYKGFITFLGNFAPSLSYDVYEAMKKNDLKKAQVKLEETFPIWSLVSKFMEKRESVSIIPKILRTNYMYMSVGKAAMDLVGLNGGPLRQPLNGLKQEEKEELEKTLQQVGVIE